MAVLVLGAYGLIGREVVRRLVSKGYAVIGLGRDVAGAARREPRIEWRRADIARLTDTASWAPLLTGVDAIVNASGALQTGLRDDIVAVQDRAMTALFAAADNAGIARFVQISAPGATADATTLFMRSKAASDAALRTSRQSWVILRPALVIAPGAYGGTALIRALAAFPGLTLLVYAKASVRTVPVGAISEAVVVALKGEIPPGSDLVLTEAKARPLAEVVGLFRAWLGLPPARVLSLPPFVGVAVSTVADALGWLGWRSPLRSTAMTVMRDGVAVGGETGDPRYDLEETLGAMPAGPQEVWYARLWLLKPAILGLLAAFWIASGVIGIVAQPAAAHLLTYVGFGREAAMAAVVGGSLLDIALGLLILVRPFARIALLGMLAVSAAYVIASFLWTPGLWLDPLGPMVKTIPAAMLALVALAILDER